MPHGFLVLDKPLGPTSRAAVDAATRWFPGAKMGHAGTLDPLATGVLVLGVGRATRLIDCVQAMPKTYRTTIVLGATSATDDAEGPIEPVAGTGPPCRTDVDAQLSSMLGWIEQTPPAYSAAKIAGRRAYAIARRGEQIELKPRQVRIDRIDVVEYQYPNLVLEIDCGKGTYIRSLARDLGRQLGCGGYVGELRRTRIGPFDLEHALPLTADPAIASARLWPLASALADTPTFSVSADQVLALRHGRATRIESHAELRTAAIVDDAGNVLSIGRCADGLFHPQRVLFEP